MSIKADGFNITIPRGDSAEIGITPHIADSGEVYLIREGERIVFTILSRDCRKTIIEKSSDLQDEHGTVVFTLFPKETDIPRGDYRWKAKLIDEKGELIDTFVGGVGYAAFYVK